MVIIIKIQEFQWTISELLKNKLKKLQIMKSELKQLEKNSIMPPMQQNFYLKDNMK